MPIEEVGSDTADRHRDDSTILMGLVKATKDITLPQYHYFCAEEDVRMLNEMPDNQGITFAVNVYAIPCPLPHEGGGDAPDGPYALMVSSKRGGLKTFMPETDPDGAKLFADWTKDYVDAFVTLNDIAGVRDIDFVCVPEFGLPLAFGDTRGPHYNGENYKAEWKTLQGLKILKDRFVCLGSAYREYNSTDGYLRKSGRRTLIDNIAYVYPVGNSPKYSITKKSIIDAKLKTISKTYYKYCGIKLSAADDGRLNCTIKIARLKLPATSDRSILFRYKEFRDLRDRDPGKAAYDIIDSAFDFHDSLVFQDRLHSPKHQFLVYKQNAAKKLSEYLDRREQAKFNVYVTEKGVVAVLICYDAYDPATFLSAMRIQGERRENRLKFPKIDIFLIPAYNSSSKFVEMCQLLSLATKSIVVYCTGHAHVKVDDRIRVFIDGIDALYRKGADEKIVSRSGLGPEHEYVTFTPVAGKPHLKVFTLSKEAILKLKKWQNQPRDGQAISGPQSIDAVKALG